MTSRAAQLGALILCTAAIAGLLASVLERANPAFFWLGLLVTTVASAMVFLRLER